MPKWNFFKLQAIIVAVDGNHWCWPYVAGNHANQITFAVGQAHRPLCPGRNVIGNGCFAVARPAIAAQGYPRVTPSQNQSYAESDTAASLDAQLADGFSWSPAWVEQLGYENSGRVLKFTPTSEDQCERSLPWRTNAPLDAGTYKVSMWVYVDDHYSHQRMFRANFGLSNDRYGSNPQGENLMFTGCVGMWREQLQRNCWQQISVILTIPALASQVEFSVLGGGYSGSFMATGLSVVRIGRDLRVSAQQDDDRQIVNRDYRLQCLDQDASTLHSMEMSLLGLDGENGARHSSFTLNVVFLDVEPNMDDDELIVGPISQLARTALM
jgi:hypothetical protein